MHDYEKGPKENTISKAEAILRVGFGLARIGVIEAGVAIRNRMPARPHLFQPLGLVGGDLRAIAFESTIPVTDVVDAPSTIPQ